MGTLNDEPEGKDTFLLRVSMNVKVQKLKVRVSNPSKHMWCPLCKMHLDSSKAPESAFTF